MRRRFVWRAIARGKDLLGTMNENENHRTRLRATRIIIEGQPVLGVLSGAVYGLKGHCLASNGSVEVEFVLF